VKNESWGGSPSPCQKGEESKTDHEVPKEKKKDREEGWNCFSCVPEIIGALYRGGKKILKRRRQKGVTVGD